jgi:hypothetical protein
MAESFDHDISDGIQLNQNVDIDFGDGGVYVESSQTTSTPGIKYTFSSLPTNTDITFTINGFCEESNAFLWVYSPASNNRLFETYEFLPETLGESDITFNVPSTIGSNVIQFGVLFTQRNVPNKFFIDKITYSYTLNSESNSVSDTLSYYNLISPTLSGIISMNGNVLNLEKSDVGLNQVDNTSDLDKPISDLTQSAIDDLNASKADISTVTEIETNVSENSVKISTLQDNLDTQSANITELETVSSQNQANITDLQENFDTLSTNFTTLETAVEQNQGNVSSLLTDVSTNQTDISTLKENVTVLSGSITTLEADVTKNKSDISSIESDITN